MKNELTNAIQVSIQHRVPSTLDGLSVSFTREFDEALPQIGGQSFRYIAEATLFSTHIKPAGAEGVVKEDAIRSISHLLYKDVITELHGFATALRAGELTLDRVLDLIDELEGRRR